MAEYAVPPDTKEKEKILGGIFTLTQFFWMVGAFMGGLGMFALVYLVTKLVPLGLIFGLIGAGVFVPFIFVKKHNLTLFEYLVRKHKFKQKNKRIYNHRPDAPKKGGFRA